MCVLTMFVAGLQLGHVCLPTLCANGLGHGSCRLSGQLRNETIRFGHTQVRAQWQKFLMAA